MSARCAIPQLTFLNAVGFGRQLSQSTKDAIFNVQPSQSPTISNRVNIVITAIYADSNRIAEAIRFLRNAHNTLSYRCFYAIG